MSPSSKTLKRFPRLFVPALLALGLMTGCTADGGDVDTAKPFDVQTLAQGLQNAGCSYTTDAGSMPIMVVDYGSHDGDPPSMARLRIDGVEHVLEKIGSESSEPFRYRNAQVTAEAFDFRDTGPECSGECEGSFYDAKLRIDYDGQSKLLDVFAHCGA